ncbi:MAG: hypothetical protein WBL87_02430 [Methanothrix sp.]
MIGRKEDGLEDDPDRLGRLAIQALALLGSLAGLLIAAFHLLGSLIFSTSSHGLGGWGLLYQMGGAVFLLLALAGIAGAALYRRSQRKAGLLLLFCGLLGFPVGYIAWINWAGFLGWAAWIPAGVLLTAAGMLALVTPQALRTRLLGQQDEAIEREPIEQGLFIGTILAGVGVMTVIFLFSGVLINAAEDSLKDDADRDREDFAEADIAASMGQWDRSVEIYDRVLSRNQSNQQAREKRSYALERLSKEDEPDQERNVEKQY